MPQRTRLWLLAALLCLLVLSCRPLDRPAAVPAFHFEDRVGGDGIPRDYGDLVSVTSVEGRQHQVVMWFEQTDDTIVGVRLNVGSGAVAERVLVIPRR